MVVAKDDPFQRIEAPEMKPWPLTVSVKPAAPAEAVAGLNDEMVGEAVLVTVKVRVFDAVLVPLGLTTPTLALPPAAIKLDGTVAVN